MTRIKRACLVFVASTASEKDRVLHELNDAGYQVCVVEAKLEYALDAKDGGPSIPADLQACIDGAEVSIFLIPEDGNTAGELGAGIGAGGSTEKPVVAVLCGNPENLPQAVDDFADTVVGIDSPELLDAIGGKAVWEDPAKPDNKERKTKRVKCQ